MKILLDESLPTKLSEFFGAEHLILSVRDMGWLGKKNGELLRLIAENNFEVFVTADRNLPYQQNLRKISFVITILRGVDNRQQTYINLILKLLQILKQTTIPKIIEVT